MISDWIREIGISFDIRTAHATCLLVLGQVHYAPNTVLCPILWSLHFQYTRLSTCNRLYLHQWPFLASDSVKPQLLYMILLVLGFLLQLRLNLHQTLSWPLFRGSLMLPYSAKTQLLSVTSSCLQNESYILHIAKFCFQLQI